MTTPTVDTPHLRVVNNFVFKKIHNPIQVFNSAMFAVFILNDDGTETLVKSMNDLQVAMRSNAVFGIDVGHLTNNGEV